MAVLARFLGDIAFAEEAVQEAFLVALAKWPGTGIPPSPAGWLITTARNHALDRLRREATRPDREHAAQLLNDPGPVEEHEVQDDHLRLVFTCCHPALAPEAQVALTLRLIGGLGTEEIAHAFLQKPAAVAQRIWRAKSKIRDARIPYRVPDKDELPGRLAAVLAVIYLVFNEGYSSSRGEEVLRTDLCDEAIRLGRLLVTLMPEEPEASGLLALMLLSDARRDARVRDGELVPLPEQDRSRWDAARIAEGHGLVRKCLARNLPGPYQLQAAIHAVHCDAPTAGGTDWRQILLLYDQLLAIAPSAVIALNRAVAVAEVHGPVHALKLIDGLDLRNYHYHHAVRADLLRRAGRLPDALLAYRAALDQCTNPGERSFLARQCQALAGDVASGAKP